MDALAAYERAIEIGLDVEEAHMNMGIVLLMLRKLKEANDSFDRAKYPNLNNLSLARQSRAIR